METAIPTRVLKLLIGYPKKHYGISMQQCSNTTKLRTLHYASYLMHSKEGGTQQILCLSFRQFRVFHLTLSRLLPHNWPLTLLSFLSVMHELLKHTRNILGRFATTRTLLYVNKRKPFLKQMDHSPTVKNTLHQRQFSSYWNHLISIRMSWLECLSTKFIMCFQGKKPHLLQFHNQFNSHNLDSCLTWLNSRHRLRQIMKFYISNSFLKNQDNERFETVCSRTEFA